MAPRRNLTKEDIRIRYKDKFCIFVRYMVVAAEDKRFVTYGDLTKLLGIPLEDLRDFADLLHKYCCNYKLPYLNSLIINTTDGMPGEDYFNCVGDGIDTWGKHIASCFSRFHLSMSNEKRFSNTTGLNEVINDFLSEE